MKVKDRLDDLRARFDSVRVAVFADLSTGMVLAVSTDEKVVQERLDALCFSGMDSLRGKTAENLAEVMIGLSDKGLNQAILFENDVVKLFVRSRTVPEDAICLMCQPDAPVDVLLQNSDAVLSAIDAEG